MKNDKKLLPFIEVKMVLSKLMDQIELKSGSESELRLLEYSLSFAEHQFGDPVVGKSCRERGDGSSMDNFEVDLVYFLPLHHMLGAIYIHKGETSENHTRDDGDTQEEIQKGYFQKAVYYFEKFLLIFEPWQIQFTLKESERCQGFDDDIMYGYLSWIFQHLGHCYFNLGYRGKADEYSLSAISYAKKVNEGESVFHRRGILHDALMLRGLMLHKGGRHAEALAAFEETYNFMAESSRPDHPDAYRAMNKIIGVLITMKEYYDAGKFRY
jgi:hypothetical protein